MRRSLSNLTEQRDYVIYEKPMRTINIPEYTSQNTEIFLGYPITHDV